MAEGASLELLVDASDGMGGEVVDEAQSAKRRRAEKGRG